ncbi:methyl-accepting chemotaxis protein [Evansella sp. AB-P1]|uniref:methyl-accepting chemotaxis protein n=1 Tax=Evansella sp. AB-P1 TaxID=3037653 RepID=UPI00241D7052|nr:methyl-accepting chemotaxis protein [Evansella sp. AB-P1]MDG5786767.1 methyl-accepting chemotaxis protein [Evansella sp. AB-P1]
MQQRKNLLMLSFTFIVVILSLITHVLHRNFHFLNEYYQSSFAHDHSAGSFSVPLNILLVIPLLLALIGLILYIKNKTHNHIPYYLTLALTFGSISIIAGGDGMVEYHFSIFMVLAILTYYESKRLIIISTVVFAIQHFAGYVLSPELITGTTEYPFSLLLIHALFLVLTSGVLLVQISANQRYKKTVLLRESEQNSVIRELNEQLTTTSKEALERIKHLEIGVKESASATEDMTNSIQYIVTGAGEQLQYAQTSHQSIENVSTEVSIITEQSKRSKESSNETLSLAESGKSSMSNTGKQMNEISMAVKLMNDVVKRLQERSSEIQNTLVFMSDIAEQTNLLALNAAIEAARAGESGRGFAIVADEVRKLADQSGQYSQQISAIIGDLLQETEAASEVMQATNQQVREGLNQVSTTEKLFEQIVENTATVHENVDDTFEKSKQIVQKVADLTDAINSMTAVSEQYQESTENMSAASEEQLATFESFNENTLILTEMMEKLDKLVHDISKRK